MANLTSSLTIKLIDEVSKPARSVAQALKDAEKAAEAVAKGMGRTAGSDPFRRQLASLKLTASELRDVRKEWLLYARASKQAMGAEWATRSLSHMRAWERQTVASIRAAKREQLALGKSIGMAARGGRLGALGGAAPDFASFALPGAAGMAMGLGAGAVGGMAVGGATAYSVKKAIDFNKAMAEVRKKVNLDAGATFADVEAMINASARRIGIAREDVAGLVAQAGQAGIEFKDLAGFMELTTKGERQVGADYAAKDIVGAMRPREFTGEADDRVKLSGRLFPQRLGGVAGVGALQALARTGEPQLLIRGDGEVLGWYLIEQVADKHSFLDVAGVGRMIELEIELVKTPQRASAAGMIATIASLFG